jgi:RHS repeat-associated protein
VDGDCAVPAQLTTTIRGLDGKVLRIYNQPFGGAWDWERDYVYRDGQLLASVEPRAGGGEDTVHFHLDHLGSPRQVTDEAGAQAAFHTYYPFGGEATVPSQDDVELKFTGHERDDNGSSGPGMLDYMHARYCSPGFGRFLSPDPLPGGVGLPQSWNRYSYAIGNPLKYIDPTGMYVISCDDGAGDCEQYAAAFEEARQANLNAADEAIRNTSLAYGDAGTDNGVVVAFEAMKQGVGGEAVADISYSQGKGSFSLSVAVTLDRSLSGDSGDRLRAVVGHEGQHVLDAQRFFATFDHKTGAHDPSKNLTLEQTETNAYLISLKIHALTNSRGKYPGKTGEVILTRGLSPKQAERRIQEIVRGPNYASKLNQRQIPRYAP